MKNTQLPAAQNGGAVPVEVNTDFGEDAGAGFENTRMEEQRTPLLRMAQGLSPELNPAKGEYIRGLALGMIFNTATREVYDGREGLECVFCWKDYGYGQWIPRDLGGGYRGMLSPDDALVRATISRMAEKYGSSARFKMPHYRDGQWSDEPARTRDTNEAIELVETGQLYALYAPNGELSADNYSRAIIPFTSTAMGAYTGYVTRHSNALWPQRDGTRKSAPIFAYRWRLTTFGDKNGKGEFSNWRIDLVPPGGSFIDALYAKNDPYLHHAARAFFTLCKTGIVKPDDTAAPAADRADSEDVPF